MYSTRLPNSSKKNKINEKEEEGDFDEMLVSISVDCMYEKK